MIALYIFLALLAVAAIAYIVVNFIPKKLHWLISLILLALIVMLSIRIVKSIMKPIKFAKEKKARYTKVINNLKMIRDAEVAYNKVNNHYTANQDSLITFIETGKFPIMEVSTKIIKVRKRGGITVNKEVRVEKEIGTKPVIDEFKGRDFKNMFKVPGTSAMFDVKVDKIEKIEGIKTPVFMAQVDKDVVLQGMDSYLISEEKEAIGGTNVKGKFISVGSLSDVKLNGNWPPIYDGKKEKE